MPTKSTTLSPIQQRLIRASFGRIARMSTNVYQVFCDRLRETDPQLQQKLKFHMKQQNIPLIETLALIVTSINSQPTMSAHLNALKHRLIGVDLTYVDYVQIGNVFLWSIEYCLKEEFTPNVHLAWSTFVNMLIDLTLTSNSNELDAGAM